jgi:hypothetical protein
MTKKLFSKINYKTILLPQFYLLNRKIIRNPYIFIPICVVLFPYNFIGSVLYFLFILAILCVLVLLEKLKNIVKRLLHYF